MPLQTARAYYELLFPRRAKPALHRLPSRQGDGERRSGLLITLHPAHAADGMPIRIPPESTGLTFGMGNDRSSTRPTRLPGRRGGGSARVVRGDLGTYPPLRYASAIGSACLTLVTEPNVGDSSGGQCLMRAETGRHCCIGGVKGSLVR